MVDRHLKIIDKAWVSGYLRSPQRKGRSQLLTRLYYPDSPKLRLFLLVSLYVGCRPALEDCLILSDFIVTFGNTVIIIYAYIYIHIIHIHIYAHIHI